MRPLALCLLLAASALAGCSRASRQRFADSPTQRQELDADAPFLKVHTHDGHVHVLEEWQLHDEARVVRGSGISYDAKRRRRASGPVQVAYDDVALLETNDPRRVVHSGLVTMGIVTGASLGVTGLCIAEPKICFGSCPTFYLADDVEAGIQAEGFSASIARSLEATDVDALSSTVESRGEFSLLMRNEALETHAVRSVALLVVPHVEGARTLRAGDDFVRARNPRPPRACRSGFGDCRDALARRDGIEYLSPASARDLATKETIELEFAAGPEASGLRIRGRNTLLNTFLFYEVLAWLGRSAGERFAALDAMEPDDETVQRLRRFGDLLADIEAEVLGPDGEWVAIGSIREVGPLASEVEVIPIPRELMPAASAGTLRARLRMTQGYWKLDDIALVGLGERVVPARHLPRAIRAQDEETEGALEALLDPDAHLVTYPGDAYELKFALPPGRYDVFLESRGYYYEWIRDHWLAKENPARARRMLRNPRRALRRLAPAYKAIEATAEEVFWRSRVQ